MKKAVFISPSIYHSILYKKYNHIPETFCRNTVLLPICIGSTFIVHNGKNYLKVFVSEYIIGHKLGEFSVTRLRNFFKKGKVTSKKKK